MTIDKGENYEIRPVFSNPFLQMMDPEGETEQMLHELMVKMTSSGMDALTSDMSTEDVGSELLNSASWAVSLRYPTRVAEFLGLFENLQMDEQTNPELYSEYRYIRVRMLCQQITNDRLSLLSVVEPIIDEEREAVGRSHYLGNMLGQLAGHGHIPALKEWMDINLGDLAKCTPDEDRYDPGTDNNDVLAKQEFMALIRDVQLGAIGYGDEEPDPLILNELLDLVEEYCQSDPSHDLSLRMLGDLEYSLDYKEYKELYVHQRAQQMYRNGLKAFLRSRIPLISGGLIENKPEKNALNELVRIGWQNPGFRSEVDDLLTELRLRGSFTEEDEAKIASWKADFTRKVKYKDKQNFSWSDHSKIPPQ